MRWDVRVGLDEGSMRQDDLQFIRLFSSPLSSCLLYGFPLISKVTFFMNSDDICHISSRNPGVAEGTLDGRLSSLSGNDHLSPSSSKGTIEGNLFLRDQHRLGPNNYYSQPNK